MPRYTLIRIKASTITVWNPDVPGMRMKIRQRAMIFRICNDCKHWEFSGADCECVCHEIKKEKQNDQPQ